MDFKMMRNSLLLIIMLLLVQASAQALPFNDDMVDTQKRTGLMMRPKVPGSVALGSLAERVESKEQASTLANPVSDHVLSAELGERLFRVNCFPCHGDIAKTPHQFGAVSLSSGGMIPSIDLSLPFYVEKSDGFFFATIHFGGLAIMPPLGWKLSALEHWNIVDYIRKVQRDKNPK